MTKSFFLFLNWTCLKFIFNQKDKRLFIWSKMLLFQKHPIFYQKKRSSLKIVAPEFQKFQFQQIFKKCLRRIPFLVKLNTFQLFFKDFAYFFRSTYLKEYLWVAASVHFSREISQGSIYFLGKYYSREYLNVKIPQVKLFQGEYLFLGGSTYLVVNECMGNSYLPVNNY